MSCNSMLRQFFCGVNVSVARLYLAPSLPNLKTARITAVGGPSWRSLVWNEEICGLLLKVAQSGDLGL